MFDEMNDVTKRVFEMDGIYVWGFLFVSLVALLIIMGQEIYGLYKRLTGPKKGSPSRPSRPNPSP
jgi:hypothetical protein